MAKINKTISVDIEDSAYIEKRKLSASKVFRKAVLDLRNTEDLDLSEPIQLAGKVLKLTKLNEKMCKFMTKKGIIDQFLAERDGK